MGLALSPLAIVEGPAGPVVGNGAERRLIHQAFEHPVAPLGSSLEAGVARGPPDGNQSSGGSRGVAGVKTRKIVDLCQELGSEHHPHTGQALYYLGLRTRTEQLLEAGID